MSESDSPTILFVDDEATAVKYFQRAIGTLATVATAGSVEEGKALLDAHANTLLVLVSDQRMPGACGNELLLYARERYPHIVRVLTTAYSELEQTVEAVNQGQIYRYIQKPWEITALRMELKQALDLARLRMDHEALLREKMMIRQQQLLAGRIGTLHALCVALGAQSFTPMESYLSAASMAGLTKPQADWAMMDHADLVAAEAARAGALGCAVKRALAGIEERFAGVGGDSLLEGLAQWLGAERFKCTGDGLEIVSTGLCAEFLAGAPESEVAEPHANWLAALLWLDGRGHVLQTLRANGAIMYHLAQPDRRTDGERLAAWIEQFQT